MVKLSERLKTVAHMCNKGNVVADIGTDHGYLPIFLLQSEIAPKALALDLRKGPLEKARRHIEENGLTDRIETRLSDGLEKLQPGEADTVTICGMGGPLMCEILSRAQDSLQAGMQVIMSPQSEWGEFRHFLSDKGFIINQEAVVLEDGKYYFIIDTTYIGKSKAFVYSNEAEYMYGKYNLERKDEILYELLQKEKKVNEEISSKLVYNKDSYSVNERLIQLNKEKDAIVKAFSYY